MSISKWNENNIKDDLTHVINTIKHFPSQGELIKMGRYDLATAIYNHGGFPKFRLLMGYKLVKKSKKSWTDEKAIEELKPIIEKLGKFPAAKDLRALRRADLYNGIVFLGGPNRFREILGYKLPSKNKGYWNDTTIIEHIKLIIEKIGDFPNTTTLRILKNTKLLGAIMKNGGFKKFRDLLNYKEIRKTWSDDDIVRDLIDISNNMKHFPSGNELIELKRTDLFNQISKRGGYLKFRELCGFSVSSRDIYISKMHSYNGHRGKKSEHLINEVISNYCKTHNIPEPSYNVKLAKGNVIEFVCDTGRKIGIDVTNTKFSQVAISRKWTRKDYYKYLDELWIVVFSDRFSEENYINWNKNSPDNVKVMSTNVFLDELDFSLSEKEKNMFSMYNSCTFHTKEDFKKLYIENIRNDVNSKEIDFMELFKKPNSTNSNIVD